MAVPVVLLHNTRSILLNVELELILAEQQDLVESVGKGGLSACRRLAHRLFSSSVYHEGVSLCASKRDQ